MTLQNPLIPESIQGIEKAITTRKHYEHKALRKVIKDEIHYLTIFTKHTLRIDFYGQ